MADSNIDQSLQKRTITLRTKPQEYQGKCVVYVMSRDQRVTFNHALLAAQQYAIENNLPLAVLFCLKSSSRYRSREHFSWMLAGLQDVESELSKFSIPFMLLIGEPHERLTGCFSHIQPDAVFFDFNPLRGPRLLQAKIANEITCNVFVVDTHNAVPVAAASNKQEFSARTIRPKIHRLFGEYKQYSDLVVEHPIKWNGTVMALSQLDDRIQAVLSEIPSNGQSNLQDMFPPGEKAAKSRLRYFIQNTFVNYVDDRNDPSKDGLSGLSPYLHFGQLSPLEVIEVAQDALAENSSLQTSFDVLFEELIVRKELSDNFCFYNEQYDSLEGAPEWAKKTLALHSEDSREFLYDLREFEKAQTHDPAWNAAQLELVQTGKMHGYMRMYWAKKVLEWSASPQTAIETLIYLNDFYSIDGGDPNGYVGILWSVAGLHDRPWGERAVYGTVRSMVYTGLKRKFNIEKYIDAHTY